VANIPSVSSPLPRDLQQFVQRVREVLDGGGADAVVTARQLIAAGVVKNRSGGGFAPVNGIIEAPRAPRDLSTSGALANIIVAWTAPNYSGHAYTEVWAHTSDVIGEAVLVGMTAGNSFAHNLGETASRYYWARNVNQNGVASAYNATNGTQGTTGTSPTYLLSVLSGAVTGTQLASALSSRIDLIDGASTLAGSVDARILSEATNTTNALALKADASTVTSLAVTVGTNTAAITSEATARTTADTSLASDITTLQTTTGGNTTSIQTNATSINGLEGQYTVKIDNNGHVSGFGLASTTVDGARVSDFIVAADRFSVVNPIETFDIDVSYSGSANHRRYVQVPASIYNAYTYVAGAGHTITVRDMGGYSKEYNIIGKSNLVSPALGYVIEFARTSNYPAPLVDFPVQSPSWFTANYPNANAAINLEVKSPFVISTGSTQINGVAVPAGTYIDTAMIGDATITNAKIGDAAIDSAKIANATIVAADIADATITGAKIGSATITSANIASATITSANIQDGTITNAKIGNTIQSTNYSDANNTGWKLEKSGNLDLNSASITAGTLQSTDGNFVIDLTNGTITISA
jgi:hypothetical protein